MKPAIEAKKIGKQYSIAHRRGGYVALRDILGGFFSRPFSISKNEKGSRGNTEAKEIFWALKDIDFTVNQGDVIGIIGRNGAGKSTLLKVLSQITPPTTGEIHIHGRVGSLLEVGTGFHPELTGRENIFLNGAILGMKKKEIAEKFDEIVAFAGIEKFLDTPVKYYSSGMYVRLAFSVAAHMDPDILIIDEVLAVGDAEFQKKCLGKMDEITKKEGRTILFVSHDMSAIRKLCRKCILIENGAMTLFGETDAVINAYIAKPMARENKDISVSYTLPEKGWEKGTDLKINVSWEKGRFEKNWECDVVFYSIDGTRLFALQSSLVPGFVGTDGASNITFEIKNPGFTGKEIRVDVGMRKSPEAIDYETVIENCLLIKPVTAGHGYVHQSAAEGIIIPEVKCTVA
jgi:lipopolysaccharide transport system ATP-binding protein